MLSYGNVERVCTTEAEVHCYISGVIYQLLVQRYKPKLRERAKLRKSMACSGSILCDPCHCSRNFHCQDYGRY